MKGRNSHMNGSDTSDTPEMRALDAALATALEPPVLPAGFEQRLAAALQADPHPVWDRAAREALEREYLDRLAELDAGYVRLRRRTLGTLIGAAFAAGAALTIAMPLLQRALGTNLPYVLAGGGALIGLALVAASLRVSRVGIRMRELLG
jgi:hypothetical protein